MYYHGDVHWCRRGPGQEYVKSALGEVVHTILSYDKSLEIDPLKVCACVCVFASKGCLANGNATH